MVGKYYQADIEIEPDTDFRIDRSLDSSRFRKETGFQPLDWEKMVRRMAADPTPYDKWKR
jgi:dTDP-4-dehydrorhamnose reductase